MSEIRVPMPRRRSAFVGPDDVALAVEGVRAGVRISMDVADDVWVRATGAAMAHATERLAEEAVWRHGPAIQDAVHSFILDRKWAEPIIVAEIQRTVRAIIADMLASSPMAEAMGYTREDAERAAQPATPHDGQNNGTRAP